MDRVAAFVDAGYVFGAGSESLDGRTRRRSELLLDCRAVVQAVAAKAKEVSGLPFLRLYWYDGSDSGPTLQQRALAECADAKLRLGFVRKDEQNRVQQKGVDSLLVTDMITLARNRAIADCVLVSGDADMQIGIQQVQEHGVRVHLLGIRSQRGANLSPMLLSEADQVHNWTADTVREFLACIPRIDPPASCRGDRGRLLEWAAQRTVEAVAALPNLLRRIHDLHRDNRPHPRDIDALLLKQGSDATGVARLPERQQHEVRKLFRQQVQRAAANLPRRIETP